MIFTLITIYTFTLFLVTVYGAIKYKKPSLLFGGLALYFWSLHGTWAIAIDKTGGISGAYYHYLEKKLFTIFLDNDYLLSVTYYYIFCIGILCTAIIVISSSHPTGNYTSRTKPQTKNILELKIKSAFILATISLALGLYIIKDSIVESIILNLSTYQSTRQYENPFFPIYQLLSRSALYISCIGSAIIFSGDRAKYIYAQGGGFIKFLMVFVAIVSISVMMLMGNKNELFVSVIGAGLFYLSNVGMNLVPLRYAWFGFGVLFMAGITDYVRGLGASNLASEMTWEGVSESFEHIIFSNEGFAAHFSMFGVLHNNIPIKFGASLEALPHNFIPRIILNERPPSIYEHYITGVSGNLDQGFTIHHATAWYLNFGLVGIVIGALLLGYLWGRLLSLPEVGEEKTVSNKAKFLIFSIVPFTVTAYFPVLLRAGITSYKPLLIEAMIIPIVLFYFITSSLKER